MTNLITQNWLPVLRRSGILETIRPADLTTQFDDDPIIDLAFPRPDWNGAVTEFLIGLFAVAFPLRDSRDVVKRWRNTASEQELTDALSPLIDYFHLFGDGSLCFQDLDPLAASKPIPISQLMIGAPGDNTIKNNQDLFIKRPTEDTHLDWPEAAAALITMQTYAPSGGQGHRTSMRGGGPFTTLIRPRRESAIGPYSTLWDTILLNQPYVRDPIVTDETLFAWLAPTKTSEGNKTVTQEDMHPLHALFGVPRRIRLIGDESGVMGFRMIPRGMNYEHWRHPLSPYYKNKDDLLPVHARDGEPSYRDWPSIYINEEKGILARAVSQAQSDEIYDLIGDAEVHGFGFDMDNMKARRWVDLRAPFLPTDVIDLLHDLVSGSGEACAALRLSTRMARFGQYSTDDEKIYIPDTIPRSAGANETTELEHLTEDVLRALLHYATSKKDDDTHGLKIAWHKELKQFSQKIFDRATDIHAATVDDLPRLVKSRSTLLRAFAPKGKIAKTLEIQTALEELRDAA